MRNCLQTASCSPPERERRRPFLPSARARHRSINYSYRVTSETRLHRRPFYGTFFVRATRPSTRARAHIINTRDGEKRRGRRDERAHIYSYRAAYTCVLLCHKNNPVLREYVRYLWTCTCAARVARQFSTSLRKGSENKPSTRSGRLKINTIVTCRGVQRNT